MSADLAALGYDPPIGISATSGDGLADLYQLLQPLVDAAGQQLQQQWEQCGPQAQQQLLQRSRSTVLVQQPQQQQQQQWASSEGSSMAQIEQVLAGADHLDHQSDLDAAAGAAAAAEEAAVDALVQQHMASSTAAASESNSDDEAGSYLDAAAAADADADTGVSATVSTDQVGEDESQQNQDQGLEGAQGPLRLAILGLPNVGKSTLMNSLLGYERSLTGGWVGGRVGAGGWAWFSGCGRAGGWGAVGWWVDMWVGEWQYFWGPEPRDSARRTVCGCIRPGSGQNGWVFSAALNVRQLHWQP
jgi:predicted GTPase